VTAGGVRLCCIGLVGLHHLFYKGAAGPLGLPPPLYAASPGAGPLGLGLQGRQPIRVTGGAASPRCRLHWRRLPWLPPSWPPALGGPSPLYNVPHMEQYIHPIVQQSISSDICVRILIFGSFLSLPFVRFFPCPFFAFLI
jgi:hypothetical protein